MNDVNQRCVSPANGTLSPDLRVNYEFGLVLGVDEFRQEDLYFREKEYLHNRALHGYGTVFGLDVTLARPSGSADDVQVTVSRGMGIDQWGRPVVVRYDQCARLGAWLAAQERKQPGVVAGHLDPAGRLSVYVVASYDECPEALVPIPGQPCSSSEATQAPSRIRDAYNIELRWTPPAMPAWDAVRCFARLMAEVHFVAGLDPLDSDEPAIIQQVRELAGPDPCAGLIGSPPSGGFQLPLETGREALDRIFTVWATDVRPQIAPDLIDPSSGPGATLPEAGILLARLDVTLATPFDPSAPRISAFDPPVDDGCPYLLHTQLIQELLLLGGGEVVAAPPPPERPPAEFVTFNTVQDAAGTRLTAWFHTDQPVKLGPALTARRDLALPITFSASPRGGPFSFLWDLTPQHEILVDDELLEFAFDTDQISVGSDAVTLADVLATQPSVYLGYDGLNTIEAFYEVDLPPPAPQPGLTEEEVIKLILRIPPRPFVTITTLSVGEGLLELWFHLALEGEDEAFRVSQKLEDPNVFRQVLRVLAETNGPFGNSLANIRVTAVTMLQHNVFRVSLNLADWKKAKNSPYLRFLFTMDLPIQAVNGQDTVLSAFIQQHRASFVGNTGGKFLVAYARVAGGGQ